MIAGRNFMVHKWFRSDTLPETNFFLHRKGRRILHPEWVSEVRIKTGRQKITKI